MPVKTDGVMFKKYKKDCTLFIETGSYIGDGIVSAINAGFEQMISVELSEHEYNCCVHKFKDNNNVTIHFGDSREKLHDILCDEVLKGRKVFFWLDAHSTGNTVGEGVQETLYPELEIVLKYITTNNVKAVLLLDDMNGITEKEVAEIVKNYPVKFVEREMSTVWPNILIYEHQMGED